MDLDGADLGAVNIRAVDTGAVNPGKVGVRPAVPGDVPQIAEVHVRGWQIGYRGLLPQAHLDGLRAAQRVPRWTESVARANWPARGTLVADKDGEVIGFAHIRPTADEDQDPAQVGEVAAFYILPTVWGKGIGRLLMAAATGRLTEAGFPAATLWVLDSNTRAIAFYRATGWSPDGAVKGDIVGGATIADHRYRRRLS